MLDLDLARLQHEILCIPLETLAEKLGVPLYLLQEEAKNKNWAPFWSENDHEPLVIDDGDDAFSLKIENYSDKARKKLIAFSLAKEIFLSQKYLELEVGIIAKAKSILDSMQDGTDSVSAVKTLSALYRDMTKNSLAANSNSAAVSIGTDETGLPTVIVRDLTGQGHKK